MIKSCPRRRLRRLALTGFSRFCGNLALRTFQCSPLRGSAFQCCAYGNFDLNKKSPSPPFEAARPCGFQSILRKPCASGLPCGFAVLTPARIVVVVFALAATAPPFTATQGLASATGTRALPPRDPGFTSFPGKRSKTRKAAVFMKRKIRCAATAILRHKPSMRGK